MLFWYVLGEVYGCGNGIEYCGVGLDYGSWLVLLLIIKMLSLWNKYEISYVFLRYVSL